MKKFIFVILLFVSFNTFAQWFRVNARVNVNAFQLYAYVDNTFAAPIVCRGSVAGITYYGQPVFAYFNNVIIYPGMFAEAYAFTNQFNPFVSVNSNVNCLWY
jgi:hypothetical protein